MIPGNFNRERELQEMLRVAKQKHALGDLSYAERTYKQILVGIPAHKEAILMYARLKYQIKKPSEALALLDRAISFFGVDADVCYLKALIFKDLGNTSSSLSEINSALALRPDFIECHHLLSEIEMVGPRYRDFLYGLHSVLKPSTYLEIGVDNGSSLRIAKNAKRVIGVDPFPSIEGGLPDNFELYRMESDKFFSEKAPALFAEHKADLSFIDGLHESHQALRDFINTEKHSSPDSLILMHDTIPLNAETATPERNTFFWSGDVWRSLIAISKFFSDVDFMTIASPPTGISLIKNLNPSRTVSAGELDTIYSFMDSLKFTDIKEQKRAVLRVQNYDPQMVTEFLGVRTKVGAKT